MDEFRGLKERIMSVSGTQSQMTSLYLKNISLMLTLVSSARESNLEMHLEAEREFLNLVHAFDMSTMPVITAINMYFCATSNISTRWCIKTSLQVDIVFLYPAHRSVASMEICSLNGLTKKQRVRPAPFDQATAQM